MRANDDYFLRFMEGHDKRFIIPIYQRNYDWRKIHCETLFNDIKKIMKHHKDYFVGSIVLLQDGMNEALIIDGQQRITTISLLLLAMANYLKNNKGDNSLIEQIIETYLLDKYAEENKRIRLKPVHKDNEAFLKLFTNNREEFILASNVTTNYEYFYNRLVAEVRSGLNIKSFFDALKLLRIVKIELNVGIDNPQEIFESLNSTGKQLDDADLVRNFILMRQNTRTQEYFYNDYWHKIEENTDFQVSDFLRHFLTYKLRYVPNQNLVYKTFKEFVLENSYENSMEELLKEILEFSKYYYKIKNASSVSILANETLQYLNKLKVTVSYPFLFDVFHMYYNQKISQSDFEEILKIIENYTLRRAICDVPSNALNKIYATLASDLQKNPHYSESYLETLKFVLLSNNQTSSRRYPDDKEFYNKFIEKDLYNNRLYRSYVLEKLENYNNNEQVNVDKLMQENLITIEHVMPQTLTKEWKDILGENANEIHQRYLHTIGNLTLTGYNSKYSNKTFEEKKNMENGFLSSRLLLNKYISQQNTWNEENIKIRGDLLTKRALKIWKNITTEYELNLKSSEYIYLSDDYDFTGHKPEKFILLGEEHSASDWAVLYRKTLEIFYSLDPSILISMAQSLDITTISTQTEGIRKAYKLGDLYFETNLSTRDIIGILTKIIEKYQLDETELGILLRK